MPVDNDLYDRMSDTWWDDAGCLNILQSALNPVRVPFLERQLRTRFATLQGLRVLDVGCGGGLLAEELARLGCLVTGIDPSRGSLEAASAHARASGLDIDYVHGVAEALPADDGAFDAVVCCDVLEHVTDVSATIHEVARVLRPGGLFLYDTINRTVRSKLLVIKIFQEWRATAFMPPNLHEHAAFVTPAELAALLRSSGLEPGSIVGIGPGVTPPLCHRADAGACPRTPHLRRVRTRPADARAARHLGALRRRRRQVRGDKRADRVAPRRRSRRLGRVRQVRPRGSQERPPTSPRRGGNAHMHVVVNHLHFRDPVTDTTIEALQDAARQMVDAGGLAARVAKVDDTHLILLLDFHSPEDADRIAREIGGAWMRDNLTPLLDRDTERSVGEVIASAEAHDR